MEINDYVRIKDGKIGKYIQPELGKPNITNGIIFNEGANYGKHSKDIIDLVEVGDYVNGYRVVEIYNATGEQMIFITILTDKGYKTILNNKFENKYIKSILTYEQF